MIKCGYIAIIGRPNVGKSTLLNRILNYKLSITSKKSQTTRHEILGIKTMDDMQFIYVDTPGLSKISKNKSFGAMNQIMNRQSSNIINQVDVILFIVEFEKWSINEDWILKKFQSVQVPVVLIVNKVDNLKNRGKAEEFTCMIKNKFLFSSSFMVSAKHGHLINELEMKIGSYLPQSENFLYPKDQITNCTERFMIAEIIREKLMRYLGDELPYQLMVKIDKCKFSKKRNITEIYGTIIVERDGQKIIIIGSEGERIKNISSMARKDIESMLGNKVFLKIWVKVKRGWSNNMHMLELSDHNMVDI